MSKQLSLSDYWNFNLPFPVCSTIAAGLIKRSKSTLSKYKREGKPCRGRNGDFTVTAVYVRTEKREDLWNISWEQSP